MTNEILHNRLRYLSSKLLNISEKVERTTEGWETSPNLSFPETRSNPAPFDYLHTFRGAESLPVLLQQTPQVIVVCGMFRSSKSTCLNGVNNYIKSFGHNLQTVSLEDAQKEAKSRGLISPNKLTVFILQLIMTFHRWYCRKWLKDF